MIEVRKRQGETNTSFLFRFSKRVKQSGVVKEVRGRRFRDRQSNRNKRRAAALYRLEKAQEYLALKKHGRISRGKNTK